MKTLYITIFLLAGIVSIQAQENKTAEKQDDIKAIKDAKAFETQMMKKQDSKKQETQTSQLASEQGLATAKQNSAQPKSNANSGKLIPNTASFDEVLASIPNRKVNRNANPKPASNAKSLPNTATLEQIKKTIPKN